MVFGFQTVEVANQSVHISAHSVAVFDGGSEHLNQRIGNTSCRKLRLKDLVNLSHLPRVGNAYLNFEVFFQHPIGIGETKQALACWLQSLRQLGDRAK
ncbi:hypothetical protein D3C85_1684370 [compost metagenome]